MEIVFEQKYAGQDPDELSFVCFHKPGGEYKATAYFYKIALNAPCRLVTDRAAEYLDLAFITLTPNHI